VTLFNFFPGQQVRWLYDFPGRRNRRSHQLRRPVAVRVIAVQKRTVHIEILREDRQVRRRWVKPPVLYPK
jgi:hypothetical protein